MNSVYNRSAAAGPRAFAPGPMYPRGVVDPSGAGGGARLEEEIACIKTITQCLDGSFRFNSQPLGSVDPAAAATATSIAETAEFFDLVVSLLSADGSAARLKTLVFEVQPSILDTLVSLLRVPTPSHLASNSAYMECRVLCVQSVTKIVSLCTDEATGYLLAEQAIRVVIGGGFFEVALAYLSGNGQGAPLGAGVEALRVAFAEAVFVLVMRSEGAAFQLIEKGGIQQLFECLFSDGSVMVRNYACATLRVLAEKSPDRVANLPIVPRALNQIKLEPSKYVVILLLEMLSLLFYACPYVYLADLHDNGSLLSELYTIIHTFLTGNTNLDVLAAVCKVMEAVLLLESSTCGEKSNYTTRLLTQGTPKVLLQREDITGADSTDADIRGLKIKMFRKLVQACTSAELTNHLQEAYTHFFPSLSLLINADGTYQQSKSGFPGAPPPPGGPGIFLTQEGRGELALAFAEILAKHPAARRYTNDTVRAYPIWIGQLRQHLLSAVDELPPPLLNGCHLVDYRGAYINSIADYGPVDYTDRVHISGVVNVMLQKQTHGDPYEAVTGVYDGSRNYQHTFIEESMEAFPGHLSDMEKKARLTHTILSHVIHLTLTADGVPQPMRPTAAPAIAGYPDENKENYPGQYDHQTPGMHTPGYTEPFATPTTGVSTPRGRSLRGRKPSRAKSPAVPHRRKPWNAGGNSGRMGLFSLAGPTRKRTDFTPGRVLDPLMADLPSGVSSSVYSTALTKVDTDYTDMAILMHLPITFGANYNRANKPTVRRFNNGSAMPYIQQTCRSNALQSWDVKDVGEGDLFSFFIPFHKLSEVRLDEELRNLHKHRLKAKKGLLTTPQTQKGKRWFFHDLYHYILPKTETLLNELKDLIAVHGASNILFYLNIIRLMENKDDEESQAIASLNPAMAPPSMSTTNLLPRLGQPYEYEREILLQNEVLRLSNGKYKDTVHGGNILYVLDRLKVYFAEKFSKSDLQLTDHLKEIEDEIARLEDKAARDIPGNEMQAEAEDDVESEYDSSVDGMGPSAKRGGAKSGGVSFDNRHVNNDFLRETDPLHYPDPEFSTDTESDVHYNLDRMRLADLSESDDGGPHLPPPAVHRSAQPQDTQAKHVSPSRDATQTRPAYEISDVSSTLSF